VDTNQLRILNRDFNRFNHKNGDIISTQPSIIGIKRIYCDKLAIWEICTIKLWGY
jgi:hypothetical protein